jgi:hypothetical protein
MRMSNATLKRKVGDLRPSQLLLTFGVGSVVELPTIGPPSTPAR